MDDYDEYRKNAVECQRMADNTRHPGDKASWLRLASSWLRMLKGKEPPPQQPAPEPRDNAAWPAARDGHSKASH